MKDFEQVDVFMPGEESKGKMKIIYNAFLEMIRDITKQFNNGSKQPLVNMKDYAPDVWHDLTKYYELTFRFDVKAQLLYLVLNYVNDPDGDQSNNMPLVFINVTGTKMLSMDADCAAYILMVSYINHLGMTSNLIKEKIANES